MQAFCYWGFFCLLLLFFNNTFYDKFLCQPFWPQQHIEMSSLEKTNKQKNDTKQTKKTLQCFLYFICLALLFRTKCPPQSKYNILLTLFFYNSIPSLKILYISFSNTISILDIMSISLKANKLYNTKSPPCYLINAFQDWVKFILIGICLTDHKIYFLKEIHGCQQLSRTQIFFFRPQAMSTISQCQVKSYKIEKKGNVVLYC